MFFSAERVRLSNSKREQKNPRHPRSKKIRVIRVPNPSAFHHKKRLPAKRTRYRQPFEKSVLGIISQ
jgi:hypothetical protein